MTTLDQLQDRLHQAWSQVGEGWRQLRDRAANALTHFRQHPTQATRPPGQREERPRWSLLTTDLWMDDQTIIVTMEIPGMDKDDFDISVVDQRLVIRGSKRTEHEDSRGRYHLIERAYGEFERAVALPDDVDQNETRAQYRNGVLRVILPRLKRSEIQRVPIDAG